MAQATEKITFTASAELAAQITEAAKADGCSRSEFLRKAMERHLALRDIGELRKYGVARAREMGITDEDIDDLIHEFREEEALKQTFTS